MKFKSKPLPGNPCMNSVLSEGRMSSESSSSKYGVRFLTALVEEKELFGENEEEERGGVG